MLIVIESTVLCLQFKRKGLQIRSVTVTPSQSNSVALPSGWWRNPDIVQISPMLMCQQSQLASLRFLCYSITDHIWSKIRRSSWNGSYFIPLTSSFPYGVLIDAKGKEAFFYAKGYEPWIENAPGSSPAERLSPHPGLSSEAAYLWMILFFKAFPR